MRKKAAHILSWKPQIFISVCVCTVQICYDRWFAGSSVFSMQIGVELFLKMICLSICVMHQHAGKTVRHTKIKGIYVIDSSDDHSSLNLLSGIKLFKVTDACASISISMALISIWIATSVNSKMAISSWYCFSNVFWYSSYAYFCGRENY